MTTETFSIKWFLVYYPVFGILLSFAAVYFISKPHVVCSYLMEQAQNEYPPPLLRNFLKYLLFFTLPCLVFSIYPFSWPEFIFSFWSIWVVFTGGSLLARWDRIRKTIVHGKDILPVFVRRAGAMMLSVALAIFILTYLLFERAFLA